MRTCCILLLAALVFASAAPAGAATITIVNIDGTNEGFNDPTPVAPVGGNPGTTRGQQRLNVFQHAAQIWGAILPSAVEIRVEAKFDPLACNTTSAVLGAAGAKEVEANFPGAIFTGTWYPMALASKLAGVDRSPASNDIGATFNSMLDDDPGCLSGADWYYGFDGNEGTTNIDLLPVVLHELGHGLGFATFTTLSNGQFLGGLPDVYARHILDTSVALHWHEMTAGQRLTSAVNTGNVVWDGASTTATAPNVLDARPVLVVGSPPAIAGTYAVGTATFGAALTTGGVTGQVALADDGVAPTSDACTALVNGATISGKIALVDRGACTFLTKAQNAQAAGAIGMILVNNVAGAPPGMTGSDPSLVIPVVSVSQADGNAIRAQLGSGVTATLKLDDTLYAGADAQGRVLLYAPNPLELGSSISHFDVSCSPNLLMEPAINRDLPAGGVDLTFQHFQDIGWSPVTPVALSDFIAASATAGGVELRWHVEGGAFTRFDVLRSKMHPEETPLELRNPGQPVPGAGPWVFVDADVEMGAIYAYRLVGHLPGGESVAAGPIVVTIDSPRRSDLVVWPNPVRDQAALRFDLPQAGRVRVRIFDVAGRQVREVVHRDATVGRFTVHWDGRDDRGRLVAAGVYVARLESGAAKVARRVVVSR